MYRRCCCLGTYFEVNYYQAIDYSRYCCYFIMKQCIYPQWFNSTMLWNILDEWLYRTNIVLVYSSSRPDSLTGITLSPRSSRRLNTPLNSRPLRNIYCTYRSCIHQVLQDKIEAYIYWPRYTSSAYRFIIRETACN